VVVYRADATGLRRAIAEVGAADVVIKASGVGVYDDELLDALVAQAAPHALRIFWDVDAPATLAEMAAAADHKLHAVLPKLDLVLTYGGGDPVIASYKSFGAPACFPIYNALDADTHHPVAADQRFNADLTFIGNRLPDREARVDAFFFTAAHRAPTQRFLLGGSGWHDHASPSNVFKLGHVPTDAHNALNCSARAVLNISRESMAATGFSPATRVFEAAGAGACLMTDDWAGIELFLQPDKEVLVVRDGADVAELLQSLTPAHAAAIGAAALKRVRRDHTYEQRAALLQSILTRAMAARVARAA